MIYKLISQQKKLEVIDFYNKGNGLVKTCLYFKLDIKIVRKIFKDYNIKIRTAKETKAITRKNNLFSIEKKFIEKCKNVHNNKYDYSLVRYTDSLKKIKIICPIHGEFEQTAISHSQGSGCSKCHNSLKKVTSFAHNQETIIQKFIKTHNNFYNYSKVNFINLTTKVEIICPEHGSFWQKPLYHIKGCGCKKCGYIKNSVNFKMGLNSFIEKAIIKHGNKYDYSKAIYPNTNKDSIDIICKKHGIFTQRVNDHLTGAGCPSCKVHYNGIKNDWIARSNNRTATFYIIKCWNKEEQFYKIGITLNGTKVRYSTFSDMPYNWEIIREIKSKDVEYIWDLEFKNKEILHKFHYKPKIYFGGSMTECFSSISGVSYIKSEEQILKEIKNEEERVEFFRTKEICEKVINSIKN